MCPKVVRTFYTTVRGGLYLCIEQHWFEGAPYDSLSLAERAAVYPLVAEKAKTLLKHGIVYLDLHGGNILVSRDLKNVAVIDFGHWPYALDVSMKRATYDMVMRKLPSA